MHVAHDALIFDVREEHFATKLHAAPRMREDENLHEVTEPRLM